MSDLNNAFHERRFMTTLLKHTGIALAILVPLAAYSSLAESATISISTQKSSSDISSMTDKIANLTPSTPIDNQITNSVSH